MRADGRDPDGGARVRRRARQLAVRRADRGHLGAARLPRQRPGGRVALGRRVRRDLRAACSRGWRSTGCCSSTTRTARAASSRSLTSADGHGRRARPADHQVAAARVRRRRARPHQGGGAATSRSRSSRCPPSAASRRCRSPTRSPRRPSAPSSNSSSASPARSGPARGSARRAPTRRSARRAPTRRSALVAVIRREAPCHPRTLRACCCYPGGRRAGWWPSPYGCGNEPPVAVSLPQPYGCQARASGTAGLGKDGMS